MTTEEKAKAYDEAMSKIKPLYEQAKRDGNPIWSTYEYLIPELHKEEKPLTPFQQCLSYILRGVYYAEVPYKEVKEFILKVVRARTDELVELAKRHEYTDCQLRESDGEKIRKGLLTAFQEMDGWWNGMLVSGILAWLEKQKEQKPISQEDFDTAKHEALWGEQKPAEKQDYSGLNDPERAIHRGFLCAGVENVPVGIIKETAKECIANFPWPTKWSKEDENIINELCNIIVSNSKNGYLGKYYAGDLVQKLKSLRPEPKPVECGCTNDESEYDKGYRKGHRFGLKQTQEYMLSGGKTFSGLIPCWVNAPSELQSAHKYHGKNVVIMHENNGGFRCVCIDDEKPVTFHLPEDTLFVEGWRKKPAEWSEENENYYDTIVRKLEIIGDDCGLSNNQIKFLREHCPSRRSEWSEEDEKAWEALYKHFSVLYPGNSQFRDTKLSNRQITKFLKSIHTARKPTEEEIEEMVNEQATKSGTTKSEMAFYRNGIKDAIKRFGLRPSWKPSEDEERLINTSISFLKDFADKGYENAVECIDWLKSKLNGNTCK